MSKIDRVTQRPLEDLPISACEDLMFIGLTVSDMQRRSKIEFTRSFDDLDYFDGALLRIGSAGYVFLKHYLRAPVPGTVIVSRPDDRSSLAAAIKFLDLKRRDVIWVRDDMRTIVASALRKRFIPVAQRPHNCIPAPPVRARHYAERKAA